MAFHLLTECDVFEATDRRFHDVDKEVRKTQKRENKSFLLACRVIVVHTCVATMVAIGIVTAAVPAAVVAVLATCSATNMIQTFQISSRTPDMIAATDNNNKDMSSSMTMIPSGLTCTDAVEELKAMNRGDLVRTFMACDPPSLSDVEGSWDGELLDNNGPVMVSCVYTGLVGSIVDDDDERFSGPLFPLGAGRVGPSMSRP